MKNKNISIKIKMPTIINKSFMYFLYYFIIIFSQILLINSSNPNDIKRRIQSEIDSLNNDDLLEKILKSGGLSDCDSDFCYQISYIDSQYVKNQENKFPQVMLSNECKKKLIAGYEASNLIVTKIFVKNYFDKDSSNYKGGISAISDIIFYQIFPFVNKRIVLYPINPEFSCGINVIHYNPLYIDDQSLQKKIIDITSQNDENDDLESIKDFDVFDPNSNFYNDRCFPANFFKYSEEENSEKKNYDMSLYQRKINYFPGNMQLCPFECKYFGIDPKTLSALCQCSFEDFSKGVKYHKEFSEFEFDIKDFKNSKKDSLYNFNIIKCAKIIFTSKGIKGIKDNYGSYILLGIYFLIFIYYILLMCYKNNHIVSLLHSVSYDLKEHDLKKIERKLRQNDKKNIDLKNDESIQSARSKDSETNLMKPNIITIKGNNGELDENKVTKDELKEIYEKKLKEIMDKKDNEIQQIIKSKNDEITQLKSSQRLYPRRSTNIQMNKNNIQFELQPQIIDMNNNLDIYKSKFDEPEEIIPLEAKFSNDELNNMDFLSSISYDKRNICDIYGSYLNQKHPLIFLFNCTSPSSISAYQRLILFLQKITIYFLVCSLFFGSEIITEIYEKKFGFKQKLKMCLNITPIIMILNSFIYNFTFNTFYQKVGQVKILFYNSDISSKNYFGIIKSALGIISSNMGYKIEVQGANDNNLKEEEKQRKGIQTLVRYLFKYFRDKICIDFFIFIVLMSAKWYFVSVFCAVYKNSQFEYFKTIFISFVMSNIFPFVYCLFLAILRKIAISGNSKCFYNINKLFRIF